MPDSMGAEWNFSPLQEFWKSVGLFLPAIHTEVVQTWEGEITGGNLGTSPVSLLPQATVCSIK